MHSSLYVAVLTHMGEQKWDQNLIEHGWYTVHIARTLFKVSLYEYVKLLCDVFNLNKYKNPSCGHDIHP